VGNNGHPVTRDVSYVFTALEVGERFAFERFRTVAAQPLSRDVLQDERAITQRKPDLASWTQSVGEPPLRLAAVGPARGVVADLVELQDRRVGIERAGLRQEEERREREDHSRITFTGWVR